MWVVRLRGGTLETGSRHDQNTMLYFYDVRRQMDERSSLTLGRRYFLASRHPAANALNVFPKPVLKHVSRPASTSQKSDISQ